MLAFKETFSYIKHEKLATGYDPGQHSSWLALVKNYICRTPLLYNLICLFVAIVIAGIAYGRVSCDDKVRSVIKLAFEVNCTYCMPEMNTCDRVIL